MNRFETKYKRFNHDDSCTNKYGTKKKEKSKNVKTSVLL